MANEYKAVYDYKGYGPLYDSIQLLKEGLETIYVGTYNQLVNVTNPHYDEWNEEAKTLGYFEKGADESLYLEYIRRKKDEILREELNKGCFRTAKEMMQPVGGTYEWYFDEECELHMSLTGDQYGYGYIDVSFHLEEK